LESDSQAALDLIANARQNEFHPHATILSLIIKLYVLPSLVSFSHTLREGNEYADWLAKYGSGSIDTLKIWTSPPPHLDSILFANSTEVFRHRNA
jgi:hypothetical protein